MIDKLSNQSRIIIATALSFAFFATYDYFFIPKKDPAPQALSQEISQQATTQKAPVVSNTQETSVKTPITVTKEGETLVRVIADKYELTIDSFGRINSFYLKESKYIMENGERMQLIDQELAVFPLEMRFSDSIVNEQAFKIPYTASVNSVSVGEQGGSVVLKQALNGVNITKMLTFYPAGNYNLAVTFDNPKSYFITPGIRPNQAVDSYTFHGALIKEADDTHTPIDDGDAKGSEKFIDAKIAAGADKYYTTALYSFDKGIDIVVEPIKDKMPLLFIKAEGDLSISGYIGAKEYKTLFQIDPQLTDIIEYGFFTFISKPLFLLLSYLHSLFGNWGWAIVVMTMIIRLVLFPLTYKGMVSMNKLKELSPKIKELQVKYKGDSQKLNAHMMELYKKHGANPMGGCLPIILQIPVFFAIYRVLQNAIELKAAPWILWVHDLAIMDPYFILPVAMGITMFVHQRITPTNFTDPMQEKIMKFLPLIFTFFFVTFPAGLTLYWFTNNLFSIAQQYYVNSLFAKEKEKKAVV
ncbi:MAG: membrane protein insertase YidC [Sulfurospirillum sp.]|nr:membrane protein insertase YidC [Sulfurospirillum sp.]